MLFNQSTISHNNSEITQEKMKHNDRIVQYNEKSLKTIIDMIEGKGIKGLFSWKILLDWQIKSIYPLTLMCLTTPCICPRTIPSRDYVRE